MAKRKAARPAQPAARRKSTSAARSRSATASAKSRRSATRRGAKAAKTSARPAARTAAAKKAARKTAPKAGAKKAAVSRKSTRAAGAARPATKKAVMKGAVKQRAVKKAAPKKAGATRGAVKQAVAKPAAKPAARKSTVAAPPPRKAPALNRARRTVTEDDIVQATPPSSLDLDRTASAARTGRRGMSKAFHEHTETSPAMTAGDVDADWESAYSVGDEAPGGDNPTPDQDIVDDIGRAVGIEYQDNEELKGADKVSERDSHRWELDPASSDDWDDRD